MNIEFGQVISCYIREKFDSGTTIKRVHEIKALVLKPNDDRALVLDLDNGRTEVIFLEDSYHPLDITLSNNMLNKARKWVQNQTAYIKRVNELEAEIELLHANNSSKLTEIKKEIMEAYKRDA